MTSITGNVNVGDVHKCDDEYDDDGDYDDEYDDDDVDDNA
jgi:hypothetical protein